jgi:hypothetical protein
MFLRNVTSNKTQTRRHIPEDRILRSHLREKPQVLHYTRCIRRKFFTNACWIWKFHLRRSRPVNDIHRWLTCQRKNIILFVQDGKCKDCINWLDIKKSRNCQVLFVYTSSNKLGKCLISICRYETDLIFHLVFLNMKVQTKTWPLQWKYTRGFCSVSTWLYTWWRYNGSRR